MDTEINLVAGWGGFLAGGVSGALIGLFFHKDEWLGGYGSFRRRLVRLGHIACFGLGFINILFALSCRGLVPTVWSGRAGLLLIIGLGTMATTCFLTAWRPGFRHLFPLPAGSTIIGIVCASVHFLRQP